MSNSLQTLLNLTRDIGVPIILGGFATFVLVKKIRPRDSIILTIAFTQLAFLASTLWTSYTHPSSSAAHLHKPCGVELSWFVFGSAVNLAGEIYHRYFPPAPAPAAPPIAIPLAPAPAAPPIAIPPSSR